MPPLIPFVMPNIHNPHDKLFQDTFKRKEVMEDFLKARLEPQLLEQIDISTLELVNASFISLEMKEFRSDVIYSAQIGGSLGYIHFLVEQQTKPKKDMVLRLLEYDVQLMRQAFKQGVEKLPVVVNFVLYTGADKYTYERSVIDAFKDRAAVLQMLDHNFLIELRAEDRETIERDGKAALVEFVLRESHTKDFCKFLASNKFVVHLMNQSSYAEQAFMWIFAKDPHEPKEVLQNVAKLDPNIKDRIMTQLQKIEERGRQEGIRLGEQRGKQEGRQETIQKLVGKGLLTLEQVRGL